MNAEHRLPFPALVGLDTAQQALLLLAVEPGLRGLVLAAPAGSGKSSLARGLPTLLGDATPFVELPLGADEDSLLGGMDLEATLRAGAHVLRRGVLAQAHGGAIYVDGLNLLPNSSANLLLAALDMGELHIEREGTSLRLPARFSLLASYDPAEGPPRQHLLDRVGLLAVLPRAASPAERAEVVRRNLALAGDRRSKIEDRGSRIEDRHALADPSSILHPPSSILDPRQQWDDELELLRGVVLAAREQLPHVQIADGQIEQLLGAAALFGVQGHRADLFAVQAARAAAALALRDAVEDEDLEVALRLVILPRATRIPTAEEPRTENREPSAQNKEQESPDRTPETGDATPETEQPGAEQDESTAAPASPPTETPPPETQNSTLNTQHSLEEQVLSALAADPSLDLAQLPFRDLCGAGAAARAAPRARGAAGISAARPATRAAPASTSARRCGRRRPGSN